MKLSVIIREVIDDGGWYGSVDNPVETQQAMTRTLELRKTIFLKMNGVVAVEKNKKSNRDQSK